MLIGQGWVTCSIQEPTAIEEWEKRFFKGKVGINKADRSSECC